MPKELEWSDLKKGLVAVVAVAAVVAGVLWFGRIGALRGETITIYMATNKAAGVMKGTEVWLGGQKVGAVTDVQFREIESDTTERIALELAVLKRHAHHIRRDSDVQIRPGTSLIGSPVIYITVGSKGANALSELDTLRARAQIENRRSGAQLISALGDSIVGIARSINQIVDTASDRGDEIAQLRRKSEAQINQVGHAIRHFTDARRAGGSAALLATDSVMHNSIKVIKAKVDSIRILLSDDVSDGGTFGSFRKDSSLMSSIESLKAQAAQIQSQILQSIEGTEFRNRLNRELKTVQIQLDSLVDNAKKRPFRYLSL